jgi:hypothetical protein
MSVQPKDAVERYLAEVLNGEGQARPEDLISGQMLRQRTTGWWQLARWPTVAIEQPAHRPHRVN